MDSSNDLLSDDNEMIIEYKIEINIENNYELSISTVNHFIVKI